MARAQHSWKNTPRKADSFLLGTIVAFAFTLVAFEWRMPRNEVVIPDGTWVDFDLPEEMLPVLILEKPKAAEPAKQRSETEFIIADPDPVVVVDPRPAPAVEPGVAGEPDPIVDPTKLNAPERVETNYSWSTVGVRPYFMDCLKRDPNNIEACTEERIDAHLHRHFHIPCSVRGKVRTTVTFQIDESGGIGRIICVPKVDDDVRVEIERVIRNMPEFVPGSQGGIPVPVYYQIPLSLRNE